MTGTPASRGSLTHEPDRFSDPAWELLLAGQDMARRWRHDQLDVEHLIQVLFSDSAFRRWVDPLPLRSDDLLDRLEDVLADQPPARGDQLFIGEDLEQLLETADQQPDPGLQTTRHRCGDQRRRRRSAGAHQSSDRPSDLALDRRSPTAARGPHR